MIQSMEILQLPIMALQERIEQEMNENPMLEVEERDESLPDEEHDDTVNPNASRTEDEKELVVQDGQSNAEDFERLANMDGDMPDTFDDFRRSSNRVQEDADRAHDLMANAAERPESLNDYLLHQLAEMDIDEDVERIAERIISCLDARDGGYLKTSLADILPPDHKPSDLQVAEQALSVVQSMEPAGIAARTLKECLLNQIRAEDYLAEEMKTVISQHLDDLAENRLPVIQKKTGYSLELIKEIREELHRLNPKPGAAFMEVIVPVVTPDVIVEPNEEGVYTVRLVDDSLPPLRISEYYRRRLADPTATEEEREFIKRKIGSAQWLIESIQQRQRTLTKVSQEIVNYQKRFLDEGPEAIEPLKMQQIADKVGVHVTTVSRAVDDKWIQTPRGIFPLRRFFVFGTTSADGEDVAYETIRMKLQEIIDKEDKSNPLSDDDLVEQLKKHGLGVARRTITKYRKKMGIPSSRQRRDWTKA
ncbi:MAG: RNA polymerase factor sigma-54 [Pirellula sp.]|jgi:RNA polymerase sigma-54 factor|nr:RNA polymerase factor sigma-54 [Pirellula sp.]